jgi:hypothetical protein
MSRDREELLEQWGDIPALVWLQQKGGKKHSCRSKKSLRGPVTARLEERYCLAKEKEEAISYVRESIAKTLW